MCCLKHKGVDTALETAAELTVLSFRVCRLSLASIYQHESDSITVFFFSFSCWPEFWKRAVGKLFTSTNINTDLISVHPSYRKKFLKVRRRFVARTAEFSDERCSFGYTKLNKNMQFVPGQKSSCCSLTCGEPTVIALKVKNDAFAWVTGRWNLFLVGINVY